MTARFMLGLISWNYCLGRRLPFTTSWEVRGAYNFISNDCQPISFAILVTSIEHQQTPRIPQRATISLSIYIQLRYPLVAPGHPPGGSFSHSHLRPTTLAASVRPLALGPDPVVIGLTALPGRRPLSSHRLQWLTGDRVPLWFESP